MSGPLSRDQAPAWLREYQDRLDTFNLAAAEWLGLDPSQVFRFALAEGKPPEGFSDHGTFARIEWESLTEQKPKTGAYTRGARGDIDGTVFTAELVLDWEDAHALTEAVGPKPRMFSAEEESRLRGMLG